MATFMTWGEHSMPINELALTVMMSVVVIREGVIIVPGMIWKTSGVVPDAGVTVNQVLSVLISQFRGS